VSIDLCSLQRNEIFSDDRGSLLISEFGQQFDFPILRQYVLYGTHAHAVRGCHAHKALWQYLVCLVGSVEVYLHDGQRYKTVRLDGARQGLLVCPMIWRELRNFSANAVLSVLASSPYDEDDYIHDFKEFQVLAALK
jgi:dTDP-4-dehydrorhamnose 3,5-epimerase-like enzyme